MVFEYDPVYFAATCLPLPCNAAAVINHDHWKQEPFKYDSLSFKSDAFAASDE